MKKHDADDDSTDLAWQRALRQAMAEPQPPLTDAEAGLKRLMRRIDDAEAEAGSAPVAAGRARRSGSGPLVPWLAAAVVVEAIGLSVLGAGLLWRDASPAAYQTLSAPAGEPAGVALRIVPAPNLRADELQALLRGLELQIVSGPNAAGAYGLALQARDANEQQVAAKVAALRAAPGVRLVEPVGGPR